MDLWAEFAGRWRQACKGVNVEGGAASPGQAGGGGLELAPGSPLPATCLRAAGALHAPWAPLQAAWLPPKGSGARALGARQLARCGGVGGTGVAAAASHGRQLPQPVQQRPGSRPRGARHTLALPSVRSRSDRLKALKHNAKRSVFSGLVRLSTRAAGGLPAARLIIRGRWRHIQAAGSAVHTKSSVSHVSLPTAHVDRAHWACRVSRAPATDLH